MPSTSIGSASEYRCYIGVLQVPIVKFCSRDGVSVDLQFNNIGTIRSSLFVRTCVEVGCSASMLTSIFKRSESVSSRHGLFSSYNLNMLAIHFIQVRTPAVFVVTDFFAMPSHDVLLPATKQSRVATSCPPRVGRVSPQCFGGHCGSTRQLLTSTDVQWCWFRLQIHELKKFQVLPGL
ncbi:unnamed protein product [Heligmosomoides polygyrus]|uniref:Uncharacterized protein n=1 Tax=Heligmosomoides polygyrus TaxID=6339 RepID=A0A3P7ZUN1_HELPZ|nr:unnamed protein product [Heligmosomoides polygyrus]